MPMNPVLESYLGDGFPNVVLGCRMATGVHGSTIASPIVKKLTTIVTIGYVTKFDSKNYYLFRDV